MLYSEHDTATAFRNSQHLLRHGEGLVAYPSYGLSVLWPIRPGDSFLLTDVGEGSTHLQ